MTNRDVSGFLAEQQRKNTGDLANEYGELEKLYDRKLWHQLTLKLLVFVKNPAVNQGDALIKLYQNFIEDFEHRINPLALMEILMYVVNKYKDPKEAAEFLEKCKEKVKASDEAVILCMTASASIKLKQQLMDEVKVLIKNAEETLDTLDGISTVHSRFYEVSSSYHKLMGNHSEYYLHALRLLGCIDLKDVPVSEQMDRAFNLGLAAILGKGVYNFGELLAHPVLDSLKNTDRQWLVDLLYAFNSGNIAQFDTLKSAWQNQPDLATHEQDMRQKISLLCLMEMTFCRPATNRQLTFKDISNETKLPIDEVELLVMKALSLNLVKGSIDQVEQKVHMTWVQPRVLDKGQISTMQKKLKEWCTDVQSMERLVEVKAQDILT